MIQIGERVRGNFTNCYIIEGKYIFNGGESTPLRYRFSSYNGDKTMLEMFNRVLRGMVECQDELDYDVIDDFDELFKYDSMYGPAWPKNSNGTYAKISSYSNYYYDEDSNKYRVTVE